jgi:hypothetical protein
LDRTDVGSALPSVIPTAASHVKSFQQDSVDATDARRGCTKLQAASN